MQISPWHNLIYRARSHSNGYILTNTEEVWVRSRWCAATSSTYCTQWCHEVLCAEIFAPSVFLSGTSTRNQRAGSFVPIPAQQPTTTPENITHTKAPDILRLCNTNFPNTAQRPSSFSCYSSKWGSHCPHLRTERLSGVGPC